MTCSRKYTQHLLVLLALLALVGVASSCAREAPSGSTATFYIDSIEAAAVQQTTVSPQDDFRRKTIVTAKACVKDVAQMQPVVNNSFRVLGEGVSSDPIAADERGCVLWTETLPFLRTQKETFVPLKRQIEAVGRHQGILQLRIAINPWRTDPSALADLSKVTVSPLASGPNALSVDSSEETARIVVRELTAHFADARYAGEEANILLNLTAAPLIARQAADGSQVFEPWARGNAAVHVILFERVRGRIDGSGDQVSEIARGQLQGSLERGEFRASDRLRVMRLPKANSLLELAFLIQPQVIVPGLRAESGLLRVRSLTSESKGKVESLPSELARWDAASTAQTAQTDAVTANQQGGVPTRSTLKRPTAATTCSDGSDQFGFYLKDWSAVFSRVTAVSKSTNTPTQIEVAFTACIATTGTEKPEPIVGQPLEVGFGSSKLQSQTTQGDGCVHWNERLSFDYFRPQRWFSGKLTVASKQAPYEGITRSVSAGINPWLRGQEMFWDCRNGGVPATGSAATTAQLTLTDFTYVYTGQDYTIDQGLTLTFHRHYRMNLIPKIRRWSAIDNAPIYDSMVPDGSYILRAMLLNPAPKRGSEPVNMGNYRFISGKELEVQVNAGMIVADLSFDFDHMELPLIAARNEIYLELAPKEPSSSLGSVNVSGIFVPLRVSDRSGLVPDLDKLTQFTAKTNEMSQKPFQDMGTLIREATLAKAQRKAAILRESGLEGFARLHKSKILTPAETAGFHYYPSDVQAGVDMKGKQRIWSFGAACNRAIRPDLAEKCRREDEARRHPPFGNLCQLVFQGSELERCRLIPDQMITARTFRVVTGKPTFYEQVDAYVDFIQIRAQITRDFSDSQAHTEGTSTRAAAFANFKIPVGGMSQVGVNVGHDWFVSDTKQQSKARSNGTQMSSGAALTSERLTMKLRAPTRECIQVNSIANSTKAGDRSVIYCVPGEKNEEFIEQYYYMQQTWVTDPTAPRDTTDIMNRPYTKVVRGEAAYQKFRGTLEDHLINISLKKDMRLQDMERYLTGAARMVNSYPPGIDSAVNGIQE